MKRIVIWALTAVICGAIIAGQAMAADWKVAHIRPAGAEIDKDLSWFADEIRKGTNGRINIKIFGSSQLGDYTVVQERVGLGSVEMSCESIATQVDKNLLIGTLQYIVFDYESGKKMFSTGGPLSNYIAKRFKRQGIKVLGWWPVYFGGIGLTKEPADPKNPNVSQNCKVRVPAMKTFEVLANSLGYQATPLPFSEFFTGAQTGMVDGIFGGGAESYYMNFRDLINWYVPANTHFEIWPLLVNEELYEELSARDKALFEKTAAEFENRRWAKAEEEQKSYEDLLEQKGCKVVRLSTEELKVFADIAKEKVFPEFRKIVGENAYAEIFSALGM
ncbi:MAG: TRAP transporter substrate-binding protein DctP [Deltaproteobacteria bacterium]|jgi:TRAP-type C4-dicarboxylate transport system substrate-binding protein|nr:TRAP transporter substrate-binding protein DctP [Deltaproteobacteria bacterium]